MFPSTRVRELLRLKSVPEAEGEFGSGTPFAVRGVTAPSSATATRTPEPKLSVTTDP